MASLGSEITVIRDNQTTDITVTLSDTDAAFFAQAAAGYANKALQYKNTTESLANRAQTNADTATARANEARASAQNAAVSEQNAASSAELATEMATDANNASENAWTAENFAREYESSASHWNDLAQNAATRAGSSATNAGNSEENALSYANSAQQYMQSASNYSNSAGLSRAQAQRYADNASQSAADAQSALDNIQTTIASKQDKLTAGANITIDANNVISATGGGGGGAVNSVNGQTGDVTITASGLGAYVKPSGGIPKTDLASAVQTSLGKADTALQSAPVTSVNGATGAVTLTASDVGALSSSTTYVSSVNGSSGAVTVNVPTKTSDLTNDSGFLTSAPVSSVDGKTGAVTVIPTGGETGQVLAKASATDRDVEWATVAGMPNVAKTLLINILKNAVYNTDQSSNITALETALDSGGGSTYYTVLNNLSNVTTNNPSIVATGGDAYAATLTVATGYVMQSVTVTMGGVDVTSAVYSNGNISIASVTGDISITAIAEAEPQRVLLYSWDFTSSLVDSVNSETAVLGGSATQDSTGIHLTSASDYVTLPNARKRNDVTYELDITSYNRQGTSHGRTLMFKSTGGMYDSGFIYRSTGKWAFYSPWSDSSITDSTAFNGKTLVAKWDSDNSIDFYLEDVLFLSGTMASPSSSSYYDLQLGSQNGNSAYNLTVTGFRIYEGVE